MRATDRSTVAVVLAVFLVTFTVLSLTSDTTILGIGWLLMGLLGVATAALRRTALPSTAVLAGQLVVWLGFVLGFSVSLEGNGQPWPQHFVAEWVSGIQHMQSQAAPMSPNDGVKLIFLCVIGLVLIVTDLVVSGLRRPAWAIVPTGAVFAVPAVGLGLETGFASFLCLALGYLGILVAEGLNTTERWTRGLSSDTTGGRGAATPVVWRAAALIGIPTLVSTLVLGSLIPTLSLSGMGVGSGVGGNGPLQLGDPTLDLRRNLNQPQDKRVISYSSDKPGGLYLRLASLPLFNASGWGNVPMQLDPGEQLPQIPGLSDEPESRRRTTINVLDFKSEYLPLPFAPRAINASGNWAYDPQSLVMLSMARGDRADAVRNLTYTVDSVDIAPDGKDLAGALVGTPVDSSVTATVPRDLPSSLTELTREVTEGAETAPQRAAAIQSFLRSDRFTYTTKAQPGTGYRALEDFLMNDRQGYCEQFAAGMAVMARIAGIPSRVAVGFLPGERRANRYDVSIRDMHAWPELYFAGFGWVRFEPTPGSVTGEAPSWTESREAPSDEESPNASAQPSTESNAPSAPASAGQTEEAVDPAAGSAFPWARTLLGSGLGLVGLLVLAAPATIRSRRRNDRLSNVGPAEDRVEGAWQEIRDTVLDYGGSWPEGSPRVVGDEVGHRLDGEDSATMSRVATLVERSRYSRSFSDDEATRSLPGMTQEIRRGLAQPQSRWRRIRATVVPSSLFRRRP